jgi:hypothetical protein
MLASFQASQGWADARPEGIGRFAHPSVSRAAGYAPYSKAGEQTGTAVVELVPYGSRSGDEVRALVAD